MRQRVALALLGLVALAAALAADTHCLGAGCPAPPVTLSLTSVVTPPGTTGAQTINADVGVVNFAALATSLVVTNNRVKSTSVCFATLQDPDAACSVMAAKPSNGSLTITLVAACLAETPVGFFCNE